MNYYINQNGLSDIDISSNDLFRNLLGSKCDEISQVLFLHLTIHGNILFKHPDVSLQGLRDITGDNDLSTYALLDVEKEATRLVEEELTMVISSIDNSNSGRLYVHAMLLCSFRLTSLFRNKTIDEMLLTL